MAALFTNEWINDLKDAWNNEPEVSDALAKINFTSTITCGYKNEDEPRCVFIVENGVATRAGLYDGETPDWDMRADEKNWAKWTQTPLNMATMGVAFTMGKLKFKTGDFKTMFKNPSMAVPFVKSFGLMCDISK